MKTTKTNKMKVLSFILSLTLLVGLVPTTVFAATSDELYVNGINILAAPNNTVVCGEGTATYDKATNTLALNNATIQTGYKGIGINKIGAIDKTNKLVIELVGNNTIATSTANQIHMAVYSMGSIDIKGSGSLNITTATNSAAYTTAGIYAWSGLTIKDSTITMNDTSSYTAALSNGIDVNGKDSSVIINDATITSNGFKIGINNPTGDVVINKSIITILNGNRGISGGNEVDNFKIIDSTVDIKVTGENALGLLNGHGIEINNSTATISSDSSNAIYTNGAITIKNNSKLDVTGFYPALFSTLDTTVTDSTVKAVSTDDSAIFSKGNLIINGTSDVTAKGHWSAINAMNNLVVNNGKVNATSTNDMGIWARGSIAINGGEIYAKGGVDGEDKLAAIGVSYEKQADDTDPVSKITVNSNYAEINGGKISVSDWDHKDRSWTSFIAKDEDKLSQGRLNALNEINIKIKGANYTAVDSAIAKANALNKDNYKDFSAVTNAINAVVRDLDITKQSEVTAMAKAIADAIAALELKGANYTAVDSAIAEANALNKDNYKDFTGVTNAIDAVVRDLDITKQAEVTAMAKAIEDAITALELKPVTPPVVTPEIVEGANQTVEHGKDATFKSDADLNDFQKVLVDGKEISSNNYILKEGSTIVTLKADYVKTLSEGKHTLSIVSINGSANTEFTIAKVATPTNPDTPQTGDNSTMILWVALLFISAGSVLTLILKRKKSVK